ncbi:MAG: lamin tail domain-containing protein [Halobacteriota archaeon]|nr:lamin tail domain-containing protein [Halobacteriota archaeon]
MKYGRSKLSAGAFIVVLIMSIFAGAVPTFAENPTTNSSGTIAAEDADLHDINISIEYSQPTGIRIKEVSGPDIAHNENLILGAEYWIKNRVTNQGEFNESVKETIKITDESGSIVYHEDTSNKIIDRESSGDFSKKWNTTTLSPGNYTIFVNATLEGFSDANYGDNNRTREVTLEIDTPPVATTGEVIISEIMYAPSSTWGGSKNEWLELYNNDTEAINLLDWTIDGKSLPEVIIQPKDYLIIAKNNTKFSQFYPSVSSPIVKLAISLKDSGEEVLLNGSSGTINDALNYTEYASGGLKWGYKNNKTIWLGKSGSWEEGLIDGGTPGGANSAETPTSPLVVINEFISNNATEWVELYNKGSTDLDLSGWTMKDGGGNIKTLSGVISAEGYAVFSYSSWLNNGGDDIRLNSTSGEVDHVAYGSSGGAPRPDDGKSVGRFPNGVDTDNDSLDFRVFEIPTIGYENTITTNQTYGVSLSQPADKTTKPGVNATYEITISNTGDQNDSFSLAVKNPDYADTAQLSMSSISLNAKENATLFLYVSDDDTGTFNVSVNAISNSDPDATDEVTVMTTISQMSISSFVSDNGVCGSTLNGSVAIRNDGDSKVNVTVVVSGLHGTTGYPLAGTGVIANLGVEQEIVLPILVYIPAGADTGNYGLFADAWIEGDYPDLRKAITSEEEVVIVTY